MMGLGGDIADRVVSAGWPVAKWLMDNWTMILLAALGLLAYAAMHGAGWV